MSQRNDIHFNFDDITCLCEFLVRDHRYIEAYCYIYAIIKCCSERIIIGRIGNNFLTARKVSKLLGMLGRVFSEVTHLNKILLKAVTGLGFEFQVESAIIYRNC